MLFVAFATVIDWVHKQAEQTNTKGKLSLWKAFFVVLFNESIFKELSMMGVLFVSVRDLECN